MAEKHITLALQDPDSLRILRSALENYRALQTTLRDAADTNAAGLTRIGEAKEAGRSMRRATELARRVQLAAALVEQVPAAELARPTGDE